MNKLAKVMISGFIIGGLLSACEDEEKDKQVEVTGPTSEASKQEIVSNDPNAEEMSQEEEITSPEEAPPTEDELNGILNYREKTKSDKYYVSAQDAQFYKPNSDFKETTMENSEFVLVNVLIEATDDITGPASIDDLNFTLKDEKNKKEYTYVTKDIMSASDYPFWKDVKDTKLTKEKPIETEVAFEVPKESNTEFMLYVTQDGDELAKIRITNIKPSKF